MVKRKNAAWVIGIAVALIAAFAVLQLYVLRETRVLRVGVVAESMWNVPDSQPNAILEAAIAKFNKQYPNVKIEYVSGIPRNEYDEWLAEKIIAGSEPDIYLVPTEQFESYAALGALQDLSPLIGADKDFSLDNYYRVATECASYNGRYYGLPLECVPTLMFVNKTLLAQYNIPMPAENWTWQDFYDICNAVTRDNDGDGTLDSFGSYGYTWQQAALSNGIDIFNISRSNPYFSSDAMSQSVHIISVLNTLNRGYRVGSRDFDLGRVAFRPFTFAEYRTYQPYPWHIKKYSSFEWDVVRFPAGPSGRNTSPVNTLVMGISSRSKETKLAWSFLKELSYDKDIQMMILSKSQGMPVRRDLLEDPKYRELFQHSVENGNVTLELIDSVLQEAVPEKYSKNYRYIMLKADDSIRNIISNNLSISTALNQLQKEINVYLEQ